MRFMNTPRLLAIPAIFICIAALGRSGAAWQGERPANVQLKRPELKLPFQRDAVLKDFPLERLEFDLPVLKTAQFRALFGNNPDVPKNDAALLAYARRLHSPAGRQQLDFCSEYEEGVLFAGMSNPDVSDETRKQVEEIIAGSSRDLIRRNDMKAPPLRRSEKDGGLRLAGFTARGQGTPAGTKPTFNRERIVGRFRFLYTDNNANASQNCTQANIDATATVLNNAWNDYTANFREPTHYLRWVLTSTFPFLESRKTIDVECYDLGGTLFGSTNSSSTTIELCSNKVIRNSLKRQTTPVHELFHRVQYAYGYVTGTAGMKWMVEATASWSQKYRAPGVGDWMDRMNSGLSSPQSRLLDRSYDACHWWVYLGRRGENERLTMRDVWQRYSANGKNAVEAVNYVIKNRVGSGYNFDTLVNWWNFAGLYKDLAATSPGYSGFTYAENSLVLSHPGGVTFGPLNQTPRTTVALNVGTNYSNSSSVSAYGARYYVFNVGSTVRRVEIKVTGASNNFGYGVIDIKDNRATTYTRTPAGGAKDQTYSKTFSAGQVTQIGLVISGIPSGGSFTVTAKGFSS